VPRQASGLEREVQDIVRREVAALLAPLRGALEGIMPSRAGGRKSAAQAVQPRRGRPPGSGKPKAGGGRSTEWTGESIKSLRKSLGLTQKAFAAKAGVTPVAIYQWESGRSHPRASSVVKLAKLGKAGGTSPQATKEAKPKARRARRRARRATLKQTAGA
jgi:DNA-binding XRE family transcriptional regulator